MGQYLIVSEKKWNKSLVPHLKSKFPKDTFTALSNISEFNYETIRKFKPNKIFFPHWSHIIPSNIFLNYECIVFHMTDLPFGRGGSPLQNLISLGFTETVVSALRATEGLDAGDIYLKRKLCLQGSAEEIYIRANQVIQSMIEEIIEYNPLPIAQSGEVVIFKRRKPHESDISKLADLDKIYDYIRMLDAEGYPNAFINLNGIQYSFRRVSKNADGHLEADVIIKRVNHVE